MTRRDAMLGLSATALVPFAARAQAAGTMLESNNSATALAVNSLVRDRDKVMLAKPSDWDLDDRTRAFSKHVMARTGGEPPNMGQAGRPLAKGGCPLVKT